MNETLLIKDLYGSVITILETNLSPDLVKNIKKDIFGCIKTIVKKHQNEMYSDVLTVPSVITKLGKVKVAKYYPGKPQPKTQGFTNILIHTSPGGIGGPLSPYVLRDEKGRLIENKWQFSKIYPFVYKQCTPLSRFHPDTIIWEHPQEVHFENNETTDEYWIWREKGMNNLYAVRYPNGFKGRKKCLFSIWPGNGDGNDETLNYIEARKKIYCGEYARLAPKTDSFKKLRAMLENGENIQIVEVDGPDPNLNYPPYNQISEENPGLTINEKTIKLLINDERKPFGHGFVIAALLLGGEKWMI